MEIQRGTSHTHWKRAWWRHCKSEGLSKLQVDCLRWNRWKHFEMEISALKAVALVVLHVIPVNLEEILLPCLIQLPKLRKL